MKFLHSLAIAAAIIACGAQINAQDSSLRETIEAAEQKWIEAFNSRNLEALLNLYTEDAECLLPDVGVKKGRAAIRERLKGALEESASRGQSETAKTLDVIGHGDFATETGLWTSRNSDESVIEEGTYVMVWKKVGDDWKVFRETWNKTSTKQKLAEALEPFDKLIGTWVAETEINGAPVRAVLTWEPKAAGSVISVEGVVRMNDEIVNEWAELIYARSDSGTIIGAGCSKTDGHRTATHHMLDDRLVSHITGFNQQGQAFAYVEEMVFGSDTIKFSQVSGFQAGNRVEQLLKDIVIKRQK